MLNELEVRVLGALIEKEITTPDYYPLSLNALVAACNQATNREPVMQLDESAVSDALTSLREQKLVHEIKSDGSRVPKYRHVVYEAYNLGRPAIAVLCVLMLRGYQTVGEIRSRSARLYDFTSIEHVENTLSNLMSGDPPFVTRLARQPGQKEVRYAHLLCGPVQSDAPEPAAATTAGGPSYSERLATLEREVEELKRQFDAFRRQFD